ncbi:MAG TPA: hypothetical protein VEC12_00345 [Bacteroidia bacterium]|nr:hypothetical protein [Bacteroidia bacterium]
MQIKQDHIVLILLALVFSGLAWLVSISTGTEGGEDSFMHYLFARYVPQHPANLLDHWGKPLHTLLLTPFAQFGFTGAKIYSALAASITAWFTYKTAQKLGMVTAMASIVLLLFSPMYFLCINSALTEITFALVLSAGIYFIVSDKYYIAAIVLSFLPFARTEGFILLPFIGIYFLLGKKYYPSLLLGLGLVLYSIIGYFHFGDLLWVFHQNPYADKTGAYPSSSHFWQYGDAYPLILGRPQTWIFIIGFLSFLMALNRVSAKGIFATDAAFKHWLLIVTLALAFFFAHSIVWHFGIMGSAGLSRVFAGIMPLLALISVRGIEAIYKPFAFNRNLRLALVCTVLFFVVEFVFKNHHFPVHFSPEERLLYKSGEWYKNSQYYKQGNKIYYFAPTVGIAYNVDPFDPSQRAYLDAARNSKNIPSGSIIVYDLHFGPNECGIPPEEIKSNPDYELLKQFTPEEPFTTLGGYNYEILIFRRK